MGWLKDLLTNLESLFRGWLRMRIWKIDDHLYQSGTLETVDPIVDERIKVITDLEGGFDTHHLIGKIDAYIYWPIVDGPIKFVNKGYLHAFATLIHKLRVSGVRCLTHCGAGRNRASLFNGVVLWNAGYKGQAIVDKIRKERPDALSNQEFERYLLELT